MYLHAQCGRFYTSRYADDDTVKDQFIGGYVGILDRLAVARLSATARTAFKQNFVVIPLMLAIGGLSTWGAYAGIMHVAPQVVDSASYRSHVNWENGSAIAATLVALLCLLVTLWEALSTNSTGHTPLSRLCDLIITRPRIISHRVTVGSSRALRALATGTCNASSSRNDSVAIFSWLQAHGDDMRTIRCFVADPQTRRIEALIESRPDDPTDEDKRRLETLKAQFDARAARVIEAITAHETHRATITDRKVSENDTKWRAEVARLTGG